MRRFQYLRPEEIVMLKWIKTTKDQATTILERNEELLHYLKSASPHGWMKKRIEIGCPHCNFDENIGFSCDECAWNVLVEGTKNRNSFYCSAVTFAGVTHHMASGVGAYDPAVTVTYGATHAVITSRNRAGLKFWNRHYLLCYRFLQGHIEWAKAVLNDWYEGEES